MILVKVIKIPYICSNINTKNTQMTNPFTYIKNQFKHKKDFWTKKNLKKKLLKYGMPLLVIFVCWEIFEDILFPLIAYALGEYVHPGFFTLIPVAWLACLHPVAVPVIYWIYLKVTREKREEDLNLDCECSHGHDHKHSH